MPTSIIYCITEANDMVFFAKICIAILLVYTYIICIILCHNIQLERTFSSTVSGRPNSPSVNSKNATVPSSEQAMSWRPLELQAMSSTGREKRLFITNNGRLRAVTHTEMDLSREPIAQQHAFCGLPVLVKSRSKMLALKRWK